MDMDERKKWLASLSESERENMKLEMLSLADKVESKIDRFVRRLKAIGINVDLGCNYPWVYLCAVNGTRVYQTFEGRHGFTILFKTDPEVRFTDRRRVFAKVREVLNGNEVKPVCEGDLLDIVDDVMDSIDVLKGYAWSRQKEADFAYEGILEILEKEFNYPEPDGY